MVTGHANRDSPRRRLHVLDDEERRGDCRAREPRGHHTPRAARVSLAGRLADLSWQGGIREFTHHTEFFVNILDILLIDLYTTIFSKNFFKNNKWNCQLFRAGCILLLT